VKAGYLEFNVNKKRHNFVKGAMGVPQGGILSPLLSNLVLHELDVFVSQLIKSRLIENGTAKPNIPNKKYRNLTNSLSRTKLKLLEEKRKKGLKYFDIGMKRRKRALIRERGRCSSSIPNPRYIKMDYVRYADD
jgi:retron-type reverse transcriptase